MRQILFIILVIAKLSAYTQNKKAIKYFDKGIEAFSNEEFKKADSLFKLSALYSPSNTTYLQIAFSQKKLGNHCAYCEYLAKAFPEGQKLYHVDCIKTDTVFYKNIKEQKAIYYSVFNFQACINERDFQFFKKYEGEEGFTSFLIIPDDSFSYKEEDFLSPYYNIENVPLKNRKDTICETIPTFPGEQDAYRKFLENNFKYPVLAYESSIQGTVYITFVVETDGTLTDIKVLRGIGGGCDEEALRLMKLMPKWNPGKLNGKPVRVQFNLPIKFILN